MIPSSVLWPVPYRLSKRCLVAASFTAIIGYISLFSPDRAFNRITPVVVSSVPPTIEVLYSLGLLCITETKSAPSSIVILGLDERVDFICL